MKNAYALSLAALLLCSCRCVEKNPRPAEKTVCTDAQYADAGIQLLTAMQERSHDKFSRLTASCREHPVSEREFRDSCRELAENLGEIRSFRFLTFLRTPAVRNLIYLVSLERTGSNGAPQYREVLFQVLIAEEKGKLRLLGFRFL